MQTNKYFLSYFGLILLCANTVSAEIDESIFMEKILISNNRESKRTARCANYDDEKNLHNFDTKNAKTIKNRHEPYQHFSLNDLVLFGDLIKSGFNQKVVPSLQQPQQCGMSYTNFSFPALRFVPNPLSKVAGGAEVVPYSWPWMAAVVFNGQFQCGGSLVDPQFVITAAHCFAKSTNPALYKVILGVHDFTSGLVVEVVRIIPHPLFNALFPRAYDIALLKLKKRVPLNSRINTVCMPTYYVLPPTVCVVTGWGRTYEGGPHASKLQEASLPVWTNGKCNMPKFYQGLVHPSMLCAGYEEGGKDSCQGDSGGPLVCKYANYQWQLHGIVSWGVGCAREGRPGVYSRVSVLAPWALLEMAKNR